MSYYLWINILAISVPLIVTFDKRLKFYQNWKYLFPAILGTMLIFIPWDAAKTSMGVWGFNPDHLQGIYLFNLPIEEWLFFIAIPYACMFTYHSFEYLIRKDYLAPYARPFTILLIVLLLIVAAFNPERWYTFITFVSTAIFLTLHLFVFKSRYLGRFYMMYFATLIPFFLVNGALTGMFTADPVVWYDDSKNLAIRLGTIPIEDAVYGLFMLLLNTTIYEWLRSKKSKLIVPAQTIVRPVS
ncbi:MAG: lycopene cyclase domain-containing protein [Lentimicrobium sp.]|jgi:lycopene cyclase domain-containing protein|nr:lycopene cyclase domain-containing protein [Lentimicrobium sp.]